MHFAECVRRVKEERGITVEQLSRTSGIPVSTLNKLLTGVIGEPKLSTALAIAGALDCTLDELTGAEHGTRNSLTEEEGQFMRRYRSLDTHGRTLVHLLMDSELSRGESDDPIPMVEAPEETRTVSLPLYLFPVSAGIGAFLDDSDCCETIDVRATKASLGADYALRVSGNSMSPRFEDGDIVLVKRQPTVEIGDLGIFVADGEGYFKRYNGQYLHSFNPAYQDILISNFSEFRCCGKVIGQLRRKRAAADT